MPDETEKPWGWIALCKGLAIVLAPIILGIPGIMAAYYGHHNSDKIDAVHGQQIENADAVKIELHERSAVTDQKLGAIQKTTDKTQATVADTLGPQLLASYKYLQELADYDPKDTTAAMRAKEAKKIYDDYIAKKNGKS